MNDLDIEKIKKLTTDKIAVSNFHEENIMISNKKNGSLFLMKTIATTAACVMLSSGMVFSKQITEYIYNYYENGKGIETALNSGYDAKFDEDYTSSSEEIVDKLNNKENKYSRR